MSKKSVISKSALRQYDLTNNYTSEFEKICQGIKKHIQRGELLKNTHEIRDPIHVFVYLDEDERKVVDSIPFQRLRHIHQLALTYLIYPGATHKRFEHSLGVMDLASRVYDIVTKPENITDVIKELLPEIKSKDKLSYWRRVLRMAALCHDIGHLPFSHAAEKELLPAGWDHEKFTQEIINSNEMKSIWNNLTPPLRSDDIVKLAIGPKKANDQNFTDWETILSEIIVGDAFGVDRMDYLLRDSHHAGVAYGKFDHYRLIDNLRILPNSQIDDKKPDYSSKEPALGIDEGGIQSVEALMLARYFMFSQVYLHSIRRIYDIHLKDFLKKWVKGGHFATEINEHLKMTDNEVTSALLDIAMKNDHNINEYAKRIIRRKHFKVLYKRNPRDIGINPEAGEAVYKALVDKFDKENFRHDRYQQKSGSPDFPVRLQDNQIVSSLAVSETLNRIPIVSVDYVFADRSVYSEAKNWLSNNITSIIEPKKEANNG